MGANFNSMTRDGKLSQDQVKQRFRDAQEQDRYENGHSYSGGIGMATGLTFKNHEPVSTDEAVEWLEEHAQKWGDALCVKVKDGPWVIGAWCSS